MYTDLQLYIDGEWLNGASRNGEEVLNPATGKSLGILPHATEGRSRPRIGLLPIRGSRCGAQRPPMTAPGCCARLPISFASAPITSPA